MRIARSVSAAALAVSLLGAGAFPAMAENYSSSSDYSSYSVTQLEALIAKLQARLAELKKGSACFVSNSDLSLGDGEGDSLSNDVRRLQEFLAEKKLFSVKPTGYFGKVTRTSLISFQAQQGVVQTGMFDAATREKAHGMTCSKTTASKGEKQEQKEEKKELPKGAGVTSITATVSGKVVRWSEVGTAPQGFKVVWSKVEGATYPPRSIDRAWYFSEPHADQAELHAFDGSGTYYVRVCEYSNGACGVYSNQVQVQL